MVGRVAMLCLHTSPLDQPGTGSGGGMNVYVRALARALGAADIEVDVFTGATGGPRRREDAPNVRVIDVPLGGPGSQVRGAVAAQAIDALATAEGRQYDLVHSHYWDSGLAGIQLARRWSVPLAHMFHTLSRVKTHFARTPVDAGRAHGEQQILDSADAIIVANHLERRHLLNLYRVPAGRLVTIPCGIDPDPFRAHWPARVAASGSPTTGDRFIVVALGRVERLKHFDLLLRAVAQACARSSQFAGTVEVRLAGGPSTREPEVLPELQRLADTLGLADRVQFVGAVAHEQVPAFYAAADVCVVPSRYESFGLVALEAMAAGLPVVATRVGGLQMSVEDGFTGYLVEPDDSAMLADRLLALWSSPALRAAMGRRGVAAAQQYAWPIVAERMGCLYEALVAAGRRASA